MMLWEVRTVSAIGGWLQGPSKWQVGDGFLFPQTIKIEGFCNSNVSVNESKWN